jgi:hypothetical protein
LRWREVAVLGAFYRAGEAGGQGVTDGASVDFMARRFQKEERWGGVGSRRGKEWGGSGSGKGVTQEAIR